MKNKNIVQGFFVILLFIFAWFQFSHATLNKAWGMDRNVKQVTLNVDGMTCASCASTIKIALRRMIGIMSVDVSVKKEKAEVKYEPEKVSVIQIIKAINNSGFKASLTTEDKI